MANGGSVASLWPNGVSTVEDLPNDLVLAIAHAQRVCSWQENLPSDEMPPRWMWSVDHELQSWFERVAEEREEKYGSKVDSGGNTVDTGLMQSNEFAARMRG